MYPNYFSSVPLLILLPFKIQCLKISSLSKYFRCSTQFLAKWRGCNIIKDNTIRKSVSNFPSISFPFLSSETTENIIKKYREREIQSLERTGSRITSSNIFSPSGSHLYIWHHLVIIHCG